MHNLFLLLKLSILSPSRMTEAGQKPVLLTREIEGFALNRIQYAILNECWRLIADDVLSVKDIDSVMKDGLGMRYAFLGPMETTHLNAEGNFLKPKRLSEQILIDFVSQFSKVSFRIASDIRRQCTL